MKHNVKNASGIEELEDLKEEAREGPVFVRCDTTLHRDAVISPTLSIASNKAIVTIHYRADKVNGSIDHTSWDCCSPGIDDMVLFSSLKGDIGWIPIGAEWTVMGLNANSISRVPTSMLCESANFVTFDESIVCVIVYNPTYVSNYPCESVFRAILRGDSCHIKSLVGTGLPSASWDSSDSSGSDMDIEWDMTYA